MKISEVLELTQTQKLADIAKEHLEIGEKKAVAAMREAGCYNISGKRGWYYEGNDSSVLEKSIYDFAPAGKRKAKANVSTNVKKAPKNNNNQRSLVDSNYVEEENFELKEVQKQIAATKELIEPTNVVRKRSSFDLDVNLLKQLKIQAVVHDKNIYEMVESAIRLYLEELKK
ncbi:hypothetical protein [Mesobacillus zeae]|uniref:hypothetical protein n=1 Tax=Mesobacillus zeae TaxID=1917180 RepID=UPI00300BF710